jgi:hypothetical protein
MASLLEPTTEPLEHLYTASILTGTKNAIDDLLKQYSAGGLSAMAFKQQNEETDHLKAAMEWRRFVLNFRDQQGRTALHIAAVDDSSSRNHSEICRLLLQLGHDPSPADSTSAPVLHYSVTTGNADSCAVVQTLLKGGASALTTYEGISALEMAAGAAAAMVDANDSGDGTKHTQTTMETTLDIVKALLRAAREEAATVATTMADNKGTGNSGGHMSGREDDEEGHQDMTTVSTLTENQAVANLLSDVPSRADYT